MSTPEFPPVQLDIAPCYRVYFEPVDFKPIKKIWEIYIRLINLKSETELGKKLVRWPHAEPPQNASDAADFQFRYDHQKRTLVWENSEDVATLPLRLPDARAHPLVRFQSRQFEPAKPCASFALFRQFDQNAKAKKPKPGTTKDLILKTTSNGHDEPAKANGNGPRTRRKSNSQNGNATPAAAATVVSEFIDALKNNVDFNPLLEERLDRAQQVRGLKALAHYWHLDGTGDVLQGLLRKRFFDLGSINAYLQERLAELGPSAPLAPIVPALLRHSSVLLFDATYARLAKLAADPDQAEMRHLLVLKCPQSANPDLADALEPSEAVELVECLVDEFVVHEQHDDTVKSLKKKTSVMTIKAFDVLNMVATSASDKLLAVNDKDLLEKMNRVRTALKSMFLATRNLNELVENTRCLTRMPNSVSCPATDYKIVQVAEKSRTLHSTYEE